MIRGEAIGLMLEDARASLERLQKAIVVDQVEEISRISRACPDCQTQRRIHDDRARKLDTLFGRVSVRAPRMCPCMCQTGDRLRTLSDEFNSKDISDKFIRRFLDRCRQFCFRQLAGHRGTNVAQDVKERDQVGRSRC
jgi:hypothetical protein